MVNGDLSLFIQKVQVLEGREFCIYTDYKPLTYILFSVCTCHSLPTICHLDFISRFTSDIRHIKRVDNNVAYTLSMDNDRQTIINYAAMAAAQQIPGRKILHKHPNFLQDVQVSCTNDFVRQETFTSLAPVILQFENVAWLILQDGNLACFLTLLLMKLKIMQVCYTSKLWKRISWKIMHDLSYTWFTSCNFLALLVFLRKTNINISDTQVTY